MHLLKERSRKIDGEIEGQREGIKEKQEGGKEERKGGRGRQRKFTEVNRQSIRSILNRATCRRKYEVTFPQFFKCHKD